MCCPGVQVFVRRNPSSSQRRCGSVLSRSTKLVPRLYEDHLPAPYIWQDPGLNRGGCRKLSSTREPKTNVKSVFWEFSFFKGLLHAWFVLACLSQSAECAVLHTLILLCTRESSEFRNNNDIKQQDPHGLWPLHYRPWRGKWGFHFPLSHFCDPLNERPAQQHGSYWPTLA